jgi:hypothetical protein
LRLVTTTLRRVARVVEHDQHPFAVHEAAEQGRAFVERNRDPARRDPEGVDEISECLGGFHRRLAGIAAVQVDVQLAVGEALGDLAPEVNGQRGLAHPRRARDDDDRHRIVGRGRPDRRQHRVQHGQLLAAAGEARRVQRQLRGHGNEAARRAGQ